MQKLHIAVFIVPIVILLIALFPLPYGYYQLLRIIVCGAAILIVYSLHEQTKRKWMLWLLGGMAVLYNPILPIHLTREIWMFINIASAAIFGLAAWLNRKEALS